MSSIAVRQHRFTVGQSPFAHNFLVLYDDDGNEAGQLHGMAMDAEDNIYLRGSSENYIRALENPKKKLDHAFEQTLWQGPHKEALIKWERAQKAGEQINSRNLSYSPLGGDFETPREPDAPRRPVIAGNSNSVFSTLVDAMDLPQPRLPIMAPGKENPLLRKDELSPPHVKGGLLSPDLPKAGLLSPYRPNDGLPMQPRRGLLGPI